jgi:mono/diheme cytochrome c family protein
MKSKTVKILTGAFALMILGAFLMSFSAPQAKTSKPWDIPAKYKSMKNPHAGDKALIATGKMAWAKHCKSCHGAMGLGDGPKAKQLKSWVGDFSTKAFQAGTDGELYYKSFIGRDEMPNFEKKITDEEERWAIVNFMRTMGK